MGIAGLNVTVPHKEAALTLAQEADPMASLVGAANTLVPSPDGWRAHNTDAQGFLLAIATDLGFHPKGRRSLLLGAGGAARAAAAALAREGAQEILVANRNRKRAEALCADLGAKVPEARLRAVPMDAAPRLIGAGDLLVSATPLGLYPDGRWPWDLTLLDPGVLAYDMAYRSSGETSLVEEARSAKLVCASGLSMLVAQGALAFSLWTGLPAPRETMEQAVATVLPP
jgi:shikimate dehydrogenase